MSVVTDVEMPFFSLLLLSSYECHSTQTHTQEVKLS